MANGKRGRKSDADIAAETGTTVEEVRKNRSAGTTVTLEQNHES